MRLIDADALKKAIQEKQDVNEETWDELYDSVMEEIDNAPTVEPEITNDDLQAAMTESYHLGYELAETKFKRPQGYEESIKAIEISAKKAQEAIEVFKQGLDKAEEQAKQILKEIPTVVCEEREQGKCPYYAG